MRYASFFLLLFLLNNSFGQLSLPDIHLKDTNGETINIKSYNGKPTLFIFIVTWAAPAIIELEEINLRFDSLTAEYNLNIVAIYSDDEKHLADLKIKPIFSSLKFPVLIDIDKKLQTYYKIAAYPESAIIDERGNYVNKITGFNNYNNFQKYLRLYLLYKPHCSSQQEINTVLKPDETVKDIDGNIYPLVQIGTQTWMKTNLKVVHFNNGDLILKRNDNNLSMTPNWTYSLPRYNSTDSTYGRQYNYRAIADSRNICPAGFHVPTDIDWCQLETFLGGPNVAAGKMYSYWGPGNKEKQKEIKNESGFKALIPQAGTMTFWSSSTFEDFLILRTIIYGEKNLGVKYITDDSISVAKNAVAHSCRCVKD